MYLVTDLLLGNFQLGKLSTDLLLGNFQHLPRVFTLQNAGGRHLLNYLTSFSPWLSPTIEAEKPTACLASLADR